MSAQAFNFVVGVISRHLEPGFKPGTKLTVIARTPGNNEADVLVTSDTIADLRGLLDRSEMREDMTAATPGDSHAT